MATPNLAEDLETQQSASVHQRDVTTYQQKQFKKSVAQDICYFNYYYFWFPLLIIVSKPFRNRLQ